MFPHRHSATAPTTPAHTHTLALLESGKPRQLQVWQILHCPFTNCSFHVLAGLCLFKKFLLVTHVDTRSSKENTESIIKAGSWFCRAESRCCLKVSYSLGKSYNFTVFSLLFLFILFFPSIFLKENFF